MCSYLKKTPLRILFLNSIQMFGGGEIWMLSAMEELQKRGHQIGIICRPGTELALRSKKSGISTFVIPMSGDFDPVTIFRFYKTIKLFKAEILLANMDKELRLAGVAAGFLKNITLIPRRGIDFPLKNHLIYRLSYQKWADGVLVNSRATKKSVLKKAPWLNPGKVKVIYNGINPERFELKSNRLREQIGITANDFVFGFAGQLDERKGIKYLLSAFVQVKKKSSNVKLIIAGDGSLKAEIETFIHRNRLEKNLFLLGFQKNIPEFMANIDALILPSLWEGFGIVLIEAMAAGKPVIGTNCSNIPEIVEHGRVGSLIPPRNSEQLAETMLIYIKNPQKVKEMGKQGQKLVREKFSLTRMVDELIDYFYTVRDQKRKKDLRPEKV